jgi:serine/threonine protein kinase
MNPDDLCMGCMANSSGAHKCPTCGYARRTPSESPVHLAPMTILEEKYVLGRVLGQGGFGITYLAYDLERDRKLAIKEYFPAYISTRASDRLSVTPLAKSHLPDMEYGLRKFHEEGEALFRFRDHPNVVQMVEFFHANGTGYIVMVFMEGCTLKQHLNDKGGKQSFSDILPRFSQVMNALRDLHSMHCFHRDISPDNIYLEDSGGVRLLDFGATRFAMGEQSQTLSVILKRGYAPEEQYRSKGHQGAWTDIYALAATMYQAITGEIPPDAMNRLQQDTLVPPTQLGADISTKAESALLKALAVKAENRFQSIAEFRTALIPSVKPVPPPPVVPVQPPPPVVPPPAPPSSRKVFLPAFVILMLLLFIFGNDPMLVGWLVLCLVLFGVLLLTLFSRMWSSIQDGHAGITPEKAVGFLLIPLFNVFWIFPVLWGFAKDYNRFVRRHAITAKRLNEPLFLACTVSLILYCLLLFWGGIATTIFLIVHAALLLPVVSQACHGIDVLPAHRPQPQPAQGEHSLSLHCLDGEYKGQRIEIEGEIVIGRDPALANLVLVSREVSGQHVRVSRDQADEKAWVEDLNSTNGTYYRYGHSPENIWIRLSGGKHLSSGDRIRLSNDAAEFLVSVT